MNNNPFYVQPMLATQSAQRGLAGLGQALIQRADFINEQQRQEKLGALYQRAITGDNAALDEMFKTDTSIAANIENKLFERAQARTNQERDLVKQQSRQFIQQMSIAKTPEQKQIVLQRFATDPSLQTVKLDEEYLLVPENMRDFSLKATAKAFGEDFFQSVYGEKPIEVSENTAGIKDWEYYKNLKETNPEEARQFGMKTGFVSREGRELSGGMQKRLATFNDNALKANVDSTRFDDLARQLERANIPGGIKGQVVEYFKEITGNQDFKSELRRDFFAVKGSEVVNNLPPGAASDSDVALALAGFPSEKASGAQMASFLRGLAKLKEFEKEYNKFASDYISENGSERGLRKAWQEAATEFEPAQRTLGRVIKGSAPEAAIEYLIANPQFKEQFLAKYGFLPEGFDD